jgi:hypothetical protein
MNMAPFFKAAVVALALPLSVSGCSDDEDGESKTVCEQAVSKLNYCGLDTTIVSSSSCTGTNRCVAECVNTISCDQIEIGSTEYTSCVSDCQ